MEIIANGEKIHGYNNKIIVKIKQHNNNKINDMFSYQAWSERVSETNTYLK